MNDQYLSMEDIPEDEINNLIYETRNRADNINKMIDSDIHLNMISESNTPLKEKMKYITNESNINSRSHDNSNLQMQIYENKRYENDYNNDLETNNIHVQNYENKRYENDFNNDLETNNYQIQNYQNKRNNNNYNNNLDIGKYQTHRYLNNSVQKEYNHKISGMDVDYELNNNSLNANHPFHRQKRHFYVFNKGSFFQNMSPFLIGNTRKLEYSMKKQNDQNKQKSEFDKIYSYDNRKFMFRNVDKTIKDYKKIGLRKSSSMTNMPLNRSHNIRHNIIGMNNYNDHSNNMINSVRNLSSRRIKYYNPRRYDYHGSRFGDDTYNYFLNAPMRGDFSADWKFPPLYYYNSIREKRLPIY